MGNGGEGGVQYGGKGVSTGYYVQVSRAVGVYIWERELGVMGAMLKVLERFHHLLARRVTGMTAQYTMVGMCEWTQVAEALETSGI